MIPTKFRFVWPSCVRVEDFLEIDNSEKRIVCGAMFVNRLGQRVCGGHVC